MFRLIRSFTPAVRVYLIVGLVALVVLALASTPHSALAAPVLHVDNNGDASGQPCTAGPSDCSLRSAIEISNDNPNVTIVFDGDYTITLSSSLVITGSFMAINAGVRSIQVDASGAGSAFNIFGNDVKLDGLHVYGAPAGTSNIYIAGAAVRVILRNNAIGRNAAGGSCAFSQNSYGGVFVNAAF